MTVGTYRVLLRLEKVIGGLYGALEGLRFNVEPDFASHDSCPKEDATTFSYGIWKYRGQTWPVNPSISWFGEGVGTVSRQRSYDDVAKGNAKDKIKDRLKEPPRSGEIFFGGAWVHRV